MKDNNLKGIDMKDINQQEELLKKVAIIKLCIIGTIGQAVKYVEFSEEQNQIVNSIIDDLQYQAGAFSFGQDSPECIIETLKELLGIVDNLIKE